MQTLVRPRLILVAGGPGAGKTTLARALGIALHLPVVVRDDVKTGYAATHPELDWTDPAVRLEHGGALFDVFHAIVGAHVDAGVAVVAEAAWHWGVAGGNLAPLLARTDPVVLHVTADHAVAAARYRARFVAGERHASHHDAAFADQMDGPDYDWRRYVPPADLPCPVVRLDGTLSPPDLLATALAAIAGEPL